MEEKKSILHELYVFSEWKPEPEYIQKPDNILPENISGLWRWLKFFGPKKSLIDSVTAYKERQQKWHIALGDEGKVIAVLADNILEIRTKRSDYATIAARTTVNRDAHSQWRKLVWSPDCSFVVLAYGTGVISFFDLTASNLFNIPTDCSRPGGLECTDNTHAVADIIFMPLRVKDTKWNWEVLVVTFDGKLRGFVVSQTEGFKLHHSFRFPGGVASVARCGSRDTLLVAGVPRASAKEPSSPLCAGITAWRILNDDPYYKLSVVSDELEAQLANERFQLYIPFITSKNLTFIIQMELSPDGSKLVCLHCNGSVSLWRLPLLRLIRTWPLSSQPEHDRRNPLVTEEKVNKKDAMVYHACDVNWWNNEELILSRFSGAVSICELDNLANILGKQPEFFQGAPRVTRAQDGAFMALECESNVLPAMRSRNDESMELIKAELEREETLVEVCKEVLKRVVYGITEMESFQPRPRRVAVVARVYRLLALRSTTPTDLFSRKIESGSYSDALTLAETFNLDSDLVYQQQWRKNPVSTDAIQKYLSKVSKKIWAVHQCVDRLPETLPAAKQLLQFGLQLTNDEILNEINKNCSEKEVKVVEDVTLEELNAYTSELLRCRHVMLFYKERLKLYEAILKCEKSSYAKDEYDRLRSNSIVQSAMEIAKEGRIEALNCLWPHVKTVAMQLAVLENLPETMCPLDFQPLLPIKQALQWFEKKSPIKIQSEHDNDWCRKEIFRSIWSSNWSEESTPETEVASEVGDDLSKWYNKRAKEIEERSGLISHAVTLITLATVGGGVEGLDNLMFHLLTLDTLVYDINIEGVTLKQLESMSTLETCTLLMKMSTPQTFVSDLKEFMIPFLKRTERLTGRPEVCLQGLIDYLESISVDDLSHILLVLQSPNEFELDVSTHLELVEKCLFAYSGTDQLDMACDLLDTILKESDGSISSSSLVRRASALERLVAGSSRLAWRGVRVPLCDLRDLLPCADRSRRLLARIARSTPSGEGKPSQQDWEKLLKDLLELQSSLFQCVTKEECYEIYASALLTSGCAAGVRLAAGVLAGAAGAGAGAMRRGAVPYARSVALVTAAANEYFNSASSLADPALELARCCLTLINDGNPDIQQELDLISALRILNEFDLGILPIQVRLCEDKMSLIEDCLKSNPNAYLAGHKLLKLATLLRIAGDDEQARESEVLLLVGDYALRGGAAGGSASVAAARRLAALRSASAAPLLVRAAAHADTTDRHNLYAAAATYCNGKDIEGILRARLGLELEGLQQLGAALKDHHGLSDRQLSNEEEFSDAITTPVLEKKDLVALSQKEKKLPLFTYLLDTFQKFTSSESKASSPEPAEHGIQCQEFYRSLYPAHRASGAEYAYDTFSGPEREDSRAVSHSLLKWYYIQNCLENGVTTELETEVVEKCGLEVLPRDSALGVACLLRCAGEAGAGSGARALTPLCAALYAALLRCNAPELRDYVYLARPVQLARRTLASENASGAQLELISACVQRLRAAAELQLLRGYGLSVNAMLYAADADYRAELIYSLARCEGEEQVRSACRLARRYGISPVAAWLEHAALHLASPHVLSTRPDIPPDDIRRVKDNLWMAIRGNDHDALINYFTILKELDERSTFGITSDEHIKMLKKAKVVAPEVDYKLVVERGPTASVQHLAELVTPEGVCWAGKLLRALPALPHDLSVNKFYTTWLTKHFFSVPEDASTKKWMQQYRQCAGYFSKLAAADLLAFLTDACFSDDAILRVPSGTRILMMTQAVEYCQQEQENNKFGKIVVDETTWESAGQELTRRVRFLENFHSDAVCKILENADENTHPIWPEVEKSHGSEELMLAAVGRLLLETDIQPGTVTSLLQCLHVPIQPPRIISYIAGRANTPELMEVVADRVGDYHRWVWGPHEGAAKRATQAASSLGPGARQKLSRLALTAREDDASTADAHAHAQDCTLQLLRNHCPERAHEYTEERIASESGRRDAFLELLKETNTQYQHTLLVDILNCWPPTRGDSNRSLQCEYIHILLQSSVQENSLELIKLLLEQYVLSEQEVKWFIEIANGETVILTIWIILLNKTKSSQEDIIKLLMQHKESILKQKVQDEMIKELLDSGMFLKLVPTPLYSSVINYILTKESAEEKEEAEEEEEEEEDTPEKYTVEWAKDELLEAKYLAEAGHLHLTTVGVPAALRGFSQTVTYCNTVFNNIDDSNVIIM